MDLSMARWRKSSFSGDNGGNCVEIAEVADVTDSSDQTVGHVDGPGHKSDHSRLIAVRDSKNPDGPKLFFTPSEWAAFVQGVKADEFNVAPGGS
ncbi:DUF397 domain-containing protein [Planotetraspora sp. A-T 1434]|uniref:DUF397 domain-containing protein n=1 Tax=Planotetraspora sp. A-T 1434 TaxID=2979219 RepID=UPI0021BE38BF|nr:DUF397 domain-containing protein [Planotetraspora sp. A-T 1434]MCT9930750.1 DUF397 domain-containing protein [Planotetraspora sp. A-T 1434]